MIRGTWAVCTTWSSRTRVLPTASSLTWKTTGYVAQCAPLGEWKSRLEMMADRDDDMELKVLVRSLESVEPYLADTSVYDISRFAKALSETGLTMPTVNVDYVTKFLKK